MKQVYTNAAISEPIARRAPCRNLKGSIFAHWRRDCAAAGPRYVVYSYGEYWPLLVYLEREDCWLVNHDRCSPTTSKHLYYVSSAAWSHPRCVDTSLETMKLFARGETIGGLREALTRRRLTGHSGGWPEKPKRVPGFGGHAYGGYGWAR